jgi:hypothetical protein
MKKKIQELFVNAMKERSVIAKASLSGLKAKITEAEKARGNKELSEMEIHLVINSAIMQRTQSYEAFIGANRPELAQKEMLEIQVLKQIQMNKFHPKAFMI